MPVKRLKLGFINCVAEEFLKEYEKIGNNKPYTYKIEPLPMEEICNICTHAKIKHMLKKGFCTCKTCNCKKFIPSKPESYKKYLRRIIISTHPKKISL